MPLIQKIENVPRKLCSARFCVLYRPYNLTGTKAPCADVNTSGAVVHYGPYFFYIRFPTPFGMPIGMANFAAGLAFFFTDITNRCHKNTSLL
jgi:hypothetical protein